MNAFALISRCLSSTLTVGLFAAVFAAGCSLASPNGALESPPEQLPAALAPVPSQPAPGPHVSLQLISVASAKYISNDDGGNVIFVPMSGACRIDLSEGSFAVLDKDCTDGIASLRLPNPDAQKQGHTSYSVYARALGRLRTATGPTTCTDDPVTYERFCPTHNTIRVRGGDTKLQAVSEGLLLTHADLDGDGVAEQHELFARQLEGYTWRHFGMGKNIAELRIYAVTSNAETLSAK